MDWKAKAAIMSLCAVTPFGDRLYLMLQKKFGRLDADPLKHIERHHNMVSWLVNAGQQIPGKVLFEAAIPGEGSNDVIV